MIVKLRVWAPLTASGGAIICAMVLSGWWFVHMPRPRIQQIPLAPESSTRASISEQGAPAPTVAAASAPSVAPTGPRVDVARVMPNGDFVVAGRTEPGARVSLLDNGKVLLETRADPATGEFVLLPPRLPEGAHQLSVRSASLADAAKTNEIAVQSFSISPQVNSRVAESPTPPGPSGGKADPHESGLDASNGKATIARGDTLWRISRERLGRGGRFMLIYQANSTKIRDPNLIYPNQTLTIP